MPSKQPSSWSSQGQPAWGAEWWASATARGDYPPLSERGSRSAQRSRRAAQLLGDFSPEELDIIPTLKLGVHLAHGQVYVDLLDPSRREFIADGRIIAGEENLYVAKADVASSIWKRLVR